MAPTAWPLLPMAACSPVAEMMRTVRLWDAKLGTPCRTLPHPGPVISLAWSPDGSLLASGDFAGTIRLWERQQSGPATLRADALRRIATGCMDWPLLPTEGAWPARVLMAPSSSGRWERREADAYARRSWGIPSGCNGVAWSPDGGTLASCSFDQTIRLWDVQQGSSRVVLHGPYRRGAWPGLHPRQPQPAQWE